MELMDMVIAANARAETRMKMDKIFSVIAFIVSFVGFIGGLVCLSKAKDDSLFFDLSLYSVVAGIIIMLVCKIVHHGFLNGLIGTIILSGVILALSCFYFLLLGKSFFGIIIDDRIVLYFILITYSFLKIFIE